MKFNLNNKKKLFIILTIVILVSFLYYVRGRSLLVSKNTDITIEFNNTFIKLSCDDEKEFKNILNSVKIYHSLTRYDGPYQNESTIFIRVHDTDKNGTIRGMLTVCLDDISKSIFLGSEPNGRFKFKKKDMQKIINFLYPVIVSSDIPIFLPAELLLH